jgi:FKBP-type peptidyl-prolyl cis-trans isomerase (trigger factor)
VVEQEVTKDVTFTFPTDFFKGGDGTDLLALNGKQVTFRIILVGSDDYDLPEFNREFITETLKMEITATDDAGAIAEYKEKQLAIINEERAEEMRLSKIRQTYLNLTEKAQGLQYFVSTDFASSLASSVRQSAFQDLQNRFIYTYGYTPSDAELNNFATAYAYSLTGDNTIQGYAGYLELVVQSQVSQELIMYYVFRHAKLEVTDEELNAAYEEHLAELVESADDPETYDKAYFVKYYGGETAIKKQVRRDLVFEKVGTYLVENNTGKKS